MKNDQEEQEKIQAEKRDRPKFKIPEPMGPVELGDRTESNESGSSQKPLTTTQA